MRYEHILRAVQTTPWALYPPILDAICTVLRERVTGARPSLAEIQARIEAAGVAAKPTQPRARPGIAVLPLYGIMAQRGGIDEASRPLLSTDAVRRAVQEALANPEVGAILLDVDSPGGSVFGVPELADAVFEARGQKPIVAVANAWAASAAYWVASQADELVVTPSGEVGSIGVLAVHEDLSKRAEMLGVKVSYVSAGRFKTEGNPFEPLSDEARAAIQGRIDDYYEAFVKAVARGRRVAQKDVRGGFGEGRMVGAAQAVALGMADRVATLDAELDRLSGRVARRAARAAVPLPSPEALRLRQRQAELR